MRFSIRNRIFLSVVLIQVLSAAFFVGWYFYTVNGNLRALSRDNAEDTVLRAISSTKGFFGPPEAFAKITASLLARGVIGRDHPERLERFLFELLRRSPYIFGLYVGYPDGAFYQVSRSDKEQVGGMRARVIRVNPTGRQVSLTWRDQNFNVVYAAKDVTDPYDPRTRPWYREAVKQHAAVWTAPYIFYTGRKPGITMAIPIISAKGTIDSVVGVDVEIGEVSQFLTKIGMGTGGSAYMVTPKANVIAYAHGGQVLDTEESKGKTLRFRKVSTLPGVDGAIGNVLMAHSAKPPSTTAPTVQEKEYRGLNYLVVAGGLGNVNWPWKVVAIVPEAGFARVLHSGNSLLIGVILLTMALACAIGYLLARNIGNPLVILHRDAKLARQPDFQAAEEISSGYPEIDETHRILRSLTTILRALAARAHDRE